MAEVLPNMYGNVFHMEQGKNTAGMPPYQDWAPPDENDAYIGWLKSEFAAANAIIDSMCHHMRTIGSPGEYDDVFGFLSRRRQAWTPSLYMQQFYSVAEVVNSLREVAWQKHQTQSMGATVSNSVPRACLVDNGIPDDESQANTHMETSSTTSEDCCKSMDLLQDKSVDDQSRELAREHSSPLDTEATNVDKLLNTRVSLASEKEDARMAAIKRSLQFQCCERVDGQMINDGESAELCENVFSDEEMKATVEAVCQLQAAGRRGDLGCVFRSCKSSGCLPDIIQFGQGAKTNGHPPMPTFVRSMVQWLTRCGILSAAKKPDSWLISIFDEGDFEPPNTDQGPWEKPFCIISVLGDSTMVFGHFISIDQQGVCKGLNQVTVPTGSVLLIQETFTGILQKAVSASPSRRITIALGKAASTNGIMELKCAHTPGQVAKNRHWAANVGAQTGHPPSVSNGIMKQGRVHANAGVIPLHPPPPMPHLIPRHPFPSIQPIFPNARGCLVNPSMPHPAMAPQGWAGTPRPPKFHTTGTGVFLPACGVNGGVPAHGWQSGLLVLSSFSQKDGALIASTTGLEVRGSRRAEKHAGHVRVKARFDSMEMKMPKKPGKRVSMAEPGQNIEGTGCGEAAAN